MITLILRITTITMSYTVILCLDILEDIVKAFWLFKKQSTYIFIPTKEWFRHDYFVLIAFLLEISWKISVIGEKLVPFYLQSTFNLKDVEIKRLTNTKFLVFNDNFYLSKTYTILFYLKNY